MNNFSIKSNGSEANQDESLAPLSAMQALQDLRNIWVSGDFRPNLHSDKHSSYLYYRDNKDGLAFQSLLSDIDTNIHSFSNASTILSLGCDCGREAAAVETFLEKKSIVDFNYKGFDIDDSGLKKGREVYAHSTSFQFLHSDLSKTDALIEFKDSADLVLVCHQNFLSAPKVWFEIFSNALKTLKTDGLLLISSFTDAEHLPACEIIEKIGGNMISSFLNRYTRIIRIATEDKPAMLVNGHIALFRKPA